MSDNPHAYPVHDFTFTRMTRPGTELPALAETADDPYADEFVLSPDAAYNETLHDLSLEDAMRDAGQTVVRTDVTPAEHALLLAARELADARQASISADAASQAAYEAAGTALDAVTAARHQHDAALAALVYPVTPRATGEDDCS